MRLAVALRPLETVTHHVRVATQIAPGRPALWIGLRMAAAMTLPLMMSPWLARPTAIAASLAGYMITLVDKGGAYRTRATMMTVASIGAVIAVLVSGLVATTPLAAPTVVIGCTLCALGQVLGPARANVTTPTAVLLAVSAFRAGPPLVLAQALAGTAFGAAWAMLLALFLWPVRVFMPGRHAIANVLDELAAYARAMAEVVAARGDRSTLFAHHRRVREQLEVARQTMVATLRGRGERDRGEQLLALVHVADRMFGNLLAVEDTLDASRDNLDAATAARALQARADMLEQLAARLLDDLARAAAAMPELADVSVESLRIEARALLATMSEHLATASRLIASLADDAAPSLAAIAEAEQMTRDRLRDALNLDSAVVRHALRVGIACTVAVVIAALVHLDYAYWVILTVYLLLQPYHSATVTRTIQRGLGTVAGALVAAALVWLVPDPRVLIPITIAFAALGASMLQLNFGLFSLFVTPTFVLLAGIQASNFALVEIRVAYTMLGGVLAVLASTLLWRSRERTLFDDLLAEAIAAGGRYVAAVRCAIAARSPLGSADILRARRAFGLALGNTEHALDRMISERCSPEQVEPRMVAIAIARRLGGAINVLGATRFLDQAEEQCSAVAADLAAVECALATLAAAVREHRPLPRAAPTRRVRDVAASSPLRRIHSYLEALFSLDLAGALRPQR